MIWLALLAGFVTGAGCFFFGYRTGEHVERLAKLAEPRYEWRAETAHVNCRCSAIPWDQSPEDLEDLGEH
jgi:hypothetical protein